ncbi:hypothetical protein CRUP_031678 [Coryphaenoides rupestris]|nr:hypothetical protein CRUP_031678 [Coryphaenoides rupestris]
MVTLHAWYSPNSDIAKNIIVWHFMNNKSTQVINFSSGEVGHGQNEFTQRVGFSVAMPSANLSIYINGTQESDSGQYICSVIIPASPASLDRCTSTWDIRMPPQNMPPSPPVCTLAGDPVQNGNVTLSCSSSQGKPEPRYKWTKAAPTSEIFFSPMQNERQGTLRLSNLTRATSGKRRRDMEEEIANEIKEDAQAPKRVSWAKSNTGSDIVSKNGTLSSIATTPRPRDPHPPSFQYPYTPVPTSDAGSVIHAYQLRPGEMSTLQGLPGYNAGGGDGTPSRRQKRPPPAASGNGVPPHAPRSPRVPEGPDRTAGAQPQVPHPATPKMSASTLTRVGGISVSVTVPVQSQAGSLV